MEKAETILTFLRARVSKAIEDRVRKVKDKVVLDSLAAHAATCESLGEFESTCRESDSRRLFQSRVLR